jgi:ribonuclease PH
MINKGALPEAVLRSPVAAISCGIVNDQELLDLCYEEDFAADVDANFVMTGEGEIIEVQGTAEGKPFAPQKFLNLLELASSGISELVESQKIAITSGTR